MTMKKANGEWNYPKVTAVIVCIATVIMAMPTAFIYLHAAVAPWTTLPEEVKQNHHEVMRELDQIKAALQMPLTMNETTNINMQLTARKYENQIK